MYLSLRPCNLNTDHSRLLDPYRDVDAVTGRQRYNERESAPD